MEDLLEGSDDDGQLTEREDGVMLNVDELIGINGSVHKRVPLPGIDLDISLSDNSSDEEEPDPGSKRKGDESSSESELKSERLLRMLSLTAPGIDLFPTTDNADNRFCFFSLDGLSLEKDCEYTRRGKLLGHGFSNERLDTILSDRWQFIRHLFPEAQSVLICDKNDFRAIMNYLLFSISVCPDENLSDLMTKAFFDLRRNYGFRWDLSLKHIIAVLMNFGVSKNSMLNEKFYNKPNVGLLKHLEQVKKSGQDTETKFKLPRLPANKPCVSAKPRRPACMMLRGGKAVPSLLIRHTVKPRLRASMSRLSSFVQACDCVLGDCSACSCEPARALHLCGVALSRVGVAR